jgi:hypothetical protein
MTNLVPCKEEAFLELFRLGLVQIGKAVRLAYEVLN